MVTIGEILAQALADKTLATEQALALADSAAADLHPLMAAAATLRDIGHGDLVSYSRKVFIPLTQLCRDVCHYCTFAHPPRRGEPVYLDAEQVLAIARAGAAPAATRRCSPWATSPSCATRAAREALAPARPRNDALLSRRDGGAGVARDRAAAASQSRRDDPQRSRALREVSVSQGIMLESAAERLRRRGGPHFGSPDKDPAVRLDTIAAAGEAAVPFTSGILIGIGETRRERIEALLALRELHERYGHIQEIIIQNFRAKPGTRMARRARARPRRPSVDDRGRPADLRAGHEHPGAAQSEPRRARGDDRGRHQRLGRRLAGHARPRQSGGAVAGARPPCAIRPPPPASLAVERLAIYPAYARDPERWLDPALRAPVLRAVDARGLRPHRPLDRRRRQRAARPRPPCSFPMQPRSPPLPRERGRVRVGWGRRA